jgi:hypothetical protein
MSEDNIDAKVENATPNDTASDRDTAIDRHRDADRERGESVRESLRQSWKDATGEDPLPDEGREARRQRDEKKSWEPKSRAAREAKEATGSYGKDAAADNKQTAADTAAQSRPAAIGPDGPTAWAKEAKQEWQRLPDSVKAAVTKRETDVANGVAALQNRYSNMEREYTDIYRALEPHLPVIRSFSHTPAQSIAQMFAWFDALSKRPDESFPVLLRSFNYDPRRLMLRPDGQRPSRIFQSRQRK